MAESGGGGKGDIKAGAAYVELLLKDIGWSKGLAAAGKQFKAVGKGMAIVGAAITAAGAAITAPLLAMVHSFAEAGGEIAKMAKRTHVSTDELQLLDFAAKRTGTSIELIQKAAFAAAKGGKSFEQMAGQVASIQDPMKQTQKAIELFGKKVGPFLVPLLRDMPKLRDEFHRLGLGMSKEDVAAAEELTDSWIDLRAIIASAKNTIGAALAPILKQATTWITNIAISVRDWVRSHRELFASALKIGVVITAVGAAITTLGGIVAASGFAITGINGVLGLMAGLFSALVSPIGIIVAGLVGLTAWFVTSHAAGRWSKD